MHVVCMQCVSSILLLYGLDLESVNNIIMIGSDEIWSTIYPIAMKVNPRERDFLKQHPSPLWNRVDNHRHNWHDVTNYDVIVQTLCERTAVSLE